MKEEELFTTLELTLDEADTLFHLMRNVGGDPRTTRRKYVDSIYNKLRSEFSVRKDVTSELVGTIMCKNFES